MNNQKRTLADGVIWNIASLAILSVGGLLFNTIITTAYDSPAVLAVFNQTYAYYIAMSQLAVFGIHNAVLRFIPVADKREQDSIVIHSLVLCMAIAVAVCAAVYLALCVAFGNSGLLVVQGVKYACIATVWFALNKVLLGVFNARQKMRMMAVFQAMRNVLICLFLIVLSYRQANGAQLALSFVYAEAILFVLQMASLVVISRNNFSFDGFKKNNFKKLVGFGRKILLSNIVMELNTRVDVVCLGLLLKDEISIGIYSFALVFAEGFYQLMVVVRKNINPMIAQNSQKEISKSKANADKRLMRLFVLAVICAALLLFAGYYIWCKLFSGSQYLAGLMPLLIIVIGQVVTSKQIVFGNILSQSGFPWEESRVNVITILSNIMMNLLMIPLLGTVGAAIATSLSYVVYATAQSYYVKKRIGTYCSLNSFLER